MSVPEHLAAAPCEHGVELDMCDTYGCTQEYNRLAEEHGGTNVTTETTSEQPTGARIELTMEHGRPAIRGYDVNGNEVLGIEPDPCACGTPSIVCECGDTRCPACDPTCEET